MPALAFVCMPEQPELASRFQEWRIDLSDLGREVTKQEDLCVTPG